MICIFFLFNTDTLIDLENLVNIVQIKILKYVYVVKDLRALIYNFKNPREFWFFVESKKMLQGKDEMFQEIKLPLALNTY